MPTENSTATPHDPPAAPPETTFFAVALLNFIEEVRGHLNAAITVRSAHLCGTHGVAANCIHINLVPV